MKHTRFITWAGLVVVLGAAGGFILWNFRAKESSKVSGEVPERSVAASLETAKRVAALEKEILSTRTQIENVREKLQSKGVAIPGVQTPSLILTKSPEVKAAASPSGVSTNPELLKIQEEVKAGEEYVKAHAVPVEELMTSNDPVYAELRQASVNDSLKKLREAHFDALQRTNLSAEEFEKVLAYKANIMTTHSMLFKFRQPPSKNQTPNLMSPYYTEADHAYLLKFYLGEKELEQSLGGEKFRAWEAYDQLNYVRDEFRNFRTLLAEHELALSSEQSSVILDYFYKQRSTRDRDELTFNVGLASDGEFRRRIELVENFDRGLSEVTRSVMNPDEILALQKAQLLALDKLKADLLRRNKEGGQWKASRHRKPIF